MPRESKEFHVPVGSCPTSTFTAADMPKEIPANIKQAFAFFHCAPRRRRHSMAPTTRSKDAALLIQIQDPFDTIEKVLRETQCLLSEARGEVKAAQLAYKTAEEKSACLEKELDELKSALTAQRERMARDSEGLVRKLDKSKKRATRLKNECSQLRQELEAREKRDGDRASAALKRAIAALEEEVRALDDATPSASPSRPTASDTSTKRKLVLAMSTVPPLHSMADPTIQKKLTPIVAPK
ncbi:hypothetical protein DFH07DRAFT_782298 [Mycena maculata]|uniref:Uncharacterized protein n=1 Tax=Mycena maculata TaxID=230809 RepID=A0AAD7HTQ6_9AGAR|nr:hypothetical protein DFH07DRAFT_782298 [Mycena maculata]